MPPILWGIPGAPLNMVGKPPGLCVFRGELWVLGVRWEAGALSITAADCKALLLPQSCLYRLRQ